MLKIKPRATTNFFHTYSQFARERIRILSGDKLGFFFELFHVDCESGVVGLLVVVGDAVGVFFEFLVFGVFGFAGAEAGEGAEKAPGAAGGREGEGVGGVVERETKWRRERRWRGSREEREGFGERR